MSLFKQVEGWGSVVLLAGGKLWPGGCWIISVTREPPFVHIIALIHLGSFS